MEKIIRVDFKETDAESLVRQSEQGFALQLEGAVRSIKKRIRDNPEIRVITLSGPTCSGKTTTAGKIIEELTGMGLRVYVVSLDDFFKSVDCDVSGYSEENSGLDLDSAGAMDLDYLRDFLSGVFRSENVYLPRFDFRKQHRTGYSLLESGRYDIFLLEGIQAVYPDVRHMLSGIPNISVFASVESAIDIGGTLFEPRGIRLMRRIVRDRLFRSASPEFTLQVWRGVTENEDKSILPNKKYADITIDSALGYEPCVIKAPLFEMLSGIDPEFPMYRMVSEISEKLVDIRSIDPGMVPQQSVFREFIGSSGIIINK